MFQPPLSNFWVLSAPTMKEGVRWGGCREHRRSHCFWYDPQGNPAGKKDDGGEGDGCNSVTMLVSVQKWQVMETLAVEPDKLVLPSWTEVPAGPLVALPSQREAGVVSRGVHSLAQSPLRSEVPSACATPRPCELPVTETQL